MTTPSRNTNVQRLLDYPVRVITPLGKITDSTTPVRGAVLREQRGASSTSPIRSDGTRAPLGWSNIGWIGKAGIVPSHYTTRDGTRTEFSMGSQSHAAATIVEAPNHDIRAVEIATNKMLANMKDQKVDLGTALSQARSTVKMLTAVGNDIAEQLSRFQRNRSKEWKRVLKRGFNNSSGRYLELVYGWKPLIDDVTGSCEELARIVHQGHSLQLTARGTGTIDKVTPRGFSGGGGYLAECYSQDTTKATVTAVMIAQNWVLQDFSRLGLTNPFVVGWENLPYSHVVDWVVPVGNWLNTFDAGAFLKFREGARSVITRSNYQYEYPRIANAQIVEAGLHVVQAPKGFGWRFDRTVLRQLPDAYFPRLRNPLTLNHMAEALTMLVQKFRVPASRVNIRF